MKDKRYFNYENIIDLIFKRDFYIFRGHNQINLNKYQLDKVATYIHEIMRKNLQLFS